MEAQLDRIIEEGKNLEGWRRAFVETPEAFAYCTRRMIRRDREQVYLLKRTQMNGAHAELFSYCLHYNDLQPIQVELYPLALLPYYEEIGIEFEPGIRIRWPGDDDSLTFEIEWSGDRFVLYIMCTYLQTLPDVAESLREMAGFMECDGRLERYAEDSEVVEVLYELRDALS